MSDEEKGDPFLMSVQLLNAINYFTRSNDMEILLRGKGVWGFVDPTDSSSERTVQAGSQRKKDLALAYKIMSIDASCKAFVMTLRDPRTVWKRLKMAYQAVSEASNDAKLTKLQSLRMGPQEPIMKFTNMIDGLVNELSASGHPVTKLEKKRALFRGLRDVFSIVAQVIRSTGKEFNEAVSQLIIFESSLEHTTDETKAMLTLHNGWLNDKKGK